MSLASPGTVQIPIATELAKNRIVILWGHFLSRRVVRLSIFKETVRERPFQWPCTSIHNVRAKVLFSNRNPVGIPSRFLLQKRSPMRNDTRLNGFEYVAGNRIRLHHGFQAAKFESATSPGRFWSLAIERHKQFTHLIW